MTPESGRRLGIARLVPLAALLALCALLAGMGSARAFAASPSCNGSQLFSQFGDTNSYALFKNGDIESAPGGVLDNWSLSGGAKQVAGNEPWNVTGSGTHSLSLPAQSTATDLITCTGLVSGIVRLFANSSNAGASSSLEIDISWKDGNGQHNDVLATLDANDYHKWSVTPQLSDSSFQTSHGSVQITFKPHGNASWTIDDIAIDPIKHH